MIEVLTREKKASLVFKLLTSEKPKHSFYHMHKKGATTLWEDWDGANSHNHPMFDGCLKALWKCFLEIIPTEPGYKKVKISPCDIPELGNFGGYLSVDGEKLSVKLSRGKGIEIETDIPENIEAILEFGGKIINLPTGKNTIKF